MITASPKKLVALIFLITFLHRGDTFLFNISEAEEGHAGSDSLAAPRIPSPTSWPFCCSKDVIFVLQQVGEEKKGKWRNRTGANVAVCTLRALKILMRQAPFLWESPDSKERVEILPVLSKQFMLSVIFFPMTSKIPSEN